MIVVALQLISLGCAIYLGLALAIHVAIPLGKWFERGSRK